MLGLDWSAKSLWRYDIKFQAFSKFLIILIDFDYLEMADIFIFPPEFFLHLLKTFKPFFLKSLEVEDFPQLIWFDGDSF